MSNFLINPYWVTSVPPDYETDFSSNTGWSADTAKIQIDTGNSEMDFRVMEPIQIRICFMI
mgnify:CR=1 FL=1